ncbi:hypothetical protein Acor_74000 [Acrocarpospora corrugata]|uniref:Uncharacterized protein n=1 Tax=Acrocarpospora corrugata TaxID=35763 RepID=A0A5M3WBB6_9ACTN|nr:hypothetical protein [Acrocarpospora corrugata]GES05332.1 hypothetical protein Acor_74000 [Acrocarpospora corrugata]
MAEARRDEFGQQQCLNTSAWDPSSPGTAELTNDTSPDNTLNFRDDGTGDWKLDMLLRGTGDLDQRGFFAVYQGLLTFRHSISDTAIQYTDAAGSLSIDLGVRAEVGSGVVWQGPQAVPLSLGPDEYTCTAYRLELHAERSTYTFWGG